MTEKEAEKEEENNRSIIMNELKKFFRPELLNRIDDIIIFHKLTQENIEQIAQKMLHTLEKRLQEMDIIMQVTPEAIHKIAQIGFDDVYGARPLRRAITSQIEDKISELMLEGKIQKGDTFALTVKDDAFDFEVQK